jgi:hypothetical protein
MNDINNEINRLNFEDIIWGIFIILSILNIVANDKQKKYVISNNRYYEDSANKISVFVLIVLLCIYLYFFLRNYKMYESKIDATDTDLIKVVGSIFFILGTICLLYFQINSDDNFIGGVAL